MPCAKTRPGPPRTLRSLQEQVGRGVYSCLKNGTPQAACAKGRHCICTDVLVEDPGGAFICGESVVNCQFCIYVADFLCDWPMGKGKTCDAPLCSEHALPVTANLDALRPDDLTRKRDPEAGAIFDRRLAELTDLHYCPAHWARDRGPARGLRDAKGEG